MKQRLKWVLHLTLAIVFLAGAHTTFAQIADVSLPPNFFSYTITGNGQVADGNIYAVPFVRNRNLGLSETFMMIMDNDGDILYYRHAEQGEDFTNFTPFPNVHKMAFFLGNPNHTQKAYIMDSTLTVVDSLVSTDDLPLDGHEILIMDDGTYWVEYLRSYTYDMSQVIDGGNPEATVVAHVIRHLDTDHSILWDWDSFDHLDELPFSDYDDQSGLLADEFQHLHTNAIEVDTDGNLLLSNRRESEVIKVKIGDGNGYVDGEVMWKLGGGTGNQFDFTNDGAFSAQHDIRRLPNGHVTVFDNGTYHDPQETFAREYELDETNMTATLVFSFSHNPPLYARATGSHRVLPNGNHLIGWGGAPDIGATEVAPDGETAWELVYDQMFEQWPHSYRYYKSTMARPVAAKPYVTALPDDGSATLYMNFFGHDSIASYDIYMTVGNGDESLLANVTDNVYTATSLTNDSTYSFRIAAHETNGDVSDYSNRIEVTPQVNAVNESGPATLPQKFAIEQNWPNPFNPTTTIRLNIRSSSVVTLSVFDVLGRRVQTLHQGLLTPGTHTFRFNGAELASGVYFVRAEAPGASSQIRKMMLLR